MPEQETLTRSRPRLYLAAPLFTPTERSFNGELKRTLSKHFTTFLPQEDGSLLTELIRTGVDVIVATRHIFKADIEALNQCNFLVAVLDGRTIDEGVAFELGYAFAKGLPCYGLQTDDRRLLPSGNNPMIDQACQRIVQTVDQLVSCLLQHHGLADPGVYQNGAFPDGAETQQRLGLSMRKQ